MTTWTKSSHCADGACVEVAWVKSSRSSTGNCVEVARIEAGHSGEGEPMTDWRKSSFCGNATCVEVSGQDGAVLVRDSKDPDGPQLRFTPDEWDAFLAGAKDGEFG